MTKLMVLISAMLLSSCKDNQIKDSNQKTTIEKTKDQIISYEPNTEELGIHTQYTMKLIPNTDGTYLISSSDIDHKDIDMTTLQNYCNNNDMNDIIINENNKIKVVEAIVSMLFKDKLLSEGKEDAGLYVFNTMNKSDSKNILNAGPFDNGDQYENTAEIVTDSMTEKSNTTKNQDTLSLEDQYILAEEKQNDTTLTPEKRKKRSHKYNRLSTEIFKPSQQDITSTY